MLDTTIGHNSDLTKDQLLLLERLCNACSVSGNESEVREIVLEQVRPHASQLKVDALGNVLAIREGTRSQLENSAALSPSSPASGTSTGRRLRVMVAAHMDEVGFMLTYDDEGGLFRFEMVGGVDAEHLPGKPVQVGRDHIPAVIGMKPIHLTKSEERHQKVDLDNLRIDVSPGNGRKVKVGDWAAFSSPFMRLGPSFCAKALDNRLGVASLVELFKSPPPNIDLLAAFTVQEEVGLRGAAVAAHALSPDLALVLDCTPARDLPVLDRSGMAENTQYNTRLGFGPAVYVADRSTLSDPRLVRHILEIAEKESLPCQVRQPGGGGTDAGAIHKQLAGIPSVSISVPARYLHTPSSICRSEDWKNSLALVYAVLAHLEPDILAAER